MRILLVDDDLFAAELASIFLQMDGDCGNRYFCPGEPGLG